MPKDKLFHLFPATPAADASDWGINGHMTYGTRKEISKPNGTKERTPIGFETSIRGVIYSLRNAVAHLNVEPKDIDDGSALKKVKSFRFRDNSGFEAELTLDQIETLARRIAKVVADDLEKIKAKRERAASKPDSSQH